MVKAWRSHLATALHPTVWSSMLRQHVGQPGDSQRSTRRKELDLAHANSRQEVF